MSLIVFASVKASPGVSTLTHEVVRRFPRRAVGVECDVSGGSWALAHGYGHDPGLLSWASERGPVQWDAIAPHAYECGRSMVVCAPSDGAQVRGALQVIEGRLRGWPDEIDGIVDVGRLTPTLYPVARDAAVVLLVSRMSAADFGVVQVEALRLRSEGIYPLLVPVGVEHSPLEFAQKCGLELAFNDEVPDDANEARNAGHPRGLFGSGKLYANVAIRLATSLASRTAHRSVTVDASTVDLELSEMLGRDLLGRDLLGGDMGASS
jgi:hypothetical protein